MDKFNPNNSPSVARALASARIQAERESAQSRADDWYWAIVFCCGVVSIALLFQVLANVVLK